MVWFVSALEMLLTFRDVENVGKKKENPLAGKSAGALSAHRQFLLIKHGNDASSSLPLLYIFLFRSLASSQYQGSSRHPVSSPPLVVAVTNRKRDLEREEEKTGCRLLVEPITNRSTLGQSLI